MSMWLFVLAAMSPSWADPVPGIDADGDGFFEWEDCDDFDPQVNPGALELCDGLDNDCDGTSDEDALDATLWYFDGDGDGIGGVVVPPIQACVGPADTSPFSDDCNDFDAQVHPGAVEFCDGVDEDCDGVVDNDAIGADVWYFDDDADGYGDPTRRWGRACAQPAGTSPNGGDCDDDHSDVHPDAIEVPDGLDNDCDGFVDNGGAFPPPPPLDMDGDGYPFPVDCDDADPTVHPGAAELCDGLDNDCDQDIDNDVTFQTWFTDLDGDGYGDAGSPPIDDCAPPAGWVENGEDCDDVDPAIHPGAIEVANGLDDDCDGSVDNGLTPPPVTPPPPTTPSPSTPPTTPSPPTAPVIPPGTPSPGPQPTILPTEPPEEVALPGCSTTGGRLPGIAGLLWRRR